MPQVARNTGIMPILSVWAISLRLSCSSWFPSLRLSPSSGVCKFYPYSCILKRVKRGPPHAGRTPAHGTAPPYLSAIFCAKVLASATVLGCFALWRMLPPDLSRIRRTSSFQCPFPCFHSSFLSPPFGCVLADRNLHSPIRELCPSYTAARIAPFSIKCVVHSHSEGLIYHAAVTPRWLSCVQYVNDKPSFFYKFFHAT